MATFYIARDSNNTYHVFEYPAAPAALCGLDEADCAEMIKKSSGDYLSGWRLCRECNTERLNQPQTETQQLELLEGNP